MREAVKRNKKDGSLLHLKMRQKRGGGGRKKGGKENGRTANTVEVWWEKNQVKRP